MKPIARNRAYDDKYVFPNKEVLDYILNHNGTYHIAEGPIRASKTQANITKWCAMVEESNDIFHLCIAPTQATAKLVLWEGDGFGIKYYPDWQAKTFMINGKKVKRRGRIFTGKHDDKDCLILLPKKNSGKPVKYIFAYGGDKVNSHEPYKGMSIGTWIATQWELLHEETRACLIGRTVASGYRKHVIDLNPTNPNHSLYAEFDLWAEDTLFRAFKMQDNPILTPERIKQIIAEYDPTSVIYQRDILGLRVAAEGLIYRVRDYNIISEFDVKHYWQYVIVADPGVNHSSTSFILLAVTHDKKYVDIIKSYSHKNAEESGLGIKSPYEYAMDFIKFIKDSIELMGKPPLDVLSDLDLTFIREFERVKYVNNLGGITLNKKFKKEEIQDRIKNGINLLFQGRLRILKSTKSDDPQLRVDGCDEVIEAFRSAMYDKKEQDKGNLVRYDNPSSGTQIDPLDATEYGLTRLRKVLNEWVGDKQ